MKIGNEIRKEYEDIIKEFSEKIKEINNKHGTFLFIVDNSSCTDLGNGLCEIESKIQIKEILVGVE